MKTLILLDDLIETLKALNDDNFEVDGDAGLCVTIFDGDKVRYFAGELKRPAINGQGGSVILILTPIEGSSP